jgi:DNA repair protein RecN (Recombination protein N)
VTLLRLQIENLALIEHADLEFHPGLNVFTGETGAGKTMLAQAIGLLAGAPPAPGMVGPHGADAYVEAEFAVGEEFFDTAPEAVRELRPDGEATLVVARRIAASGRSRALVWGRSCARDDLEQLGETLMEISSQHEARRLARPATQLELLDAAAGNAELRSAMASSWTALRDARARLGAAEEEAAAAERQRGELEELAARVGEAAIEPGERPRLEAERERLRHLDELVSAVAGAAALVNPDDGEGALTLAGRAADLVQGVERFDPALAPVAEELRDVALRLQEASVELRAQADGFEGDPGRLEEVEARLQLFADLERRFGAPAEDLPARCEEARAVLELIDGGGERRAALEREAQAALTQAESAAAALRKARSKAAKPFAKAVEGELAQLGMVGVRLEVQLEEAELGARGGDRVTLLLAANAGLPAGPIATVASGGELSRIALAVRVAARTGGGAATLLLDEVDAGVGGRTANAVADTLRRLAADAQLLCITHLPQIAGAADAHFRVEKRSGDPASTTVSRLEGEEIVDEVARMLGAEEGDDTARRHAAAMLG